MESGRAMKYLDKIIYMEGIIVAVDDGSVSVDLKGRLGFIKVPRRMIITDYEMKVGQEVGFNMSFLEVLGGEVDDKYRRNVERRQGIRSPADQASV